MRILGIDPALRITGYGVIDSRGNRLSMLEAGMVTTSTKETLGQRLDKIYNSITKLVSQTHPDVLVLEKLYAHYRHPTTSYILGQARGIICLVCQRQNIPLVEYAATRVKKAIVGRGQAGKYQIQKMVAHILNLDRIPKYTDVTDALALAIAHSYMVRSWL